jgi:hypothetical protein
VYGPLGVPTKFTIFEFIAFATIEPGEQVVVVVVGAMVVVNTGDIVVVDVVVVNTNGIKKKGLNDVT